MEIIKGLLIIAIGSLGQSSSYVPIKKVRKWSWESFWLVQGIFAWLVQEFSYGAFGFCNDYRRVSADISFQLHYTDKHGKIN